MRIVHTSDWHVGRRWKGIQRLDEIEAILEHLSEFIERESVDLVLHTGDIFDSRNPPADAERLVNEFFVRIGTAGARMVLIAGNHDDPHRLDARALLAEFTNVDILGRPRRSNQGGTRVIETSGGETAVVAALPFASPGAWVSALDLAGDEATARSKYARMFQLAVENLSGGFRREAVNLLMAHTHLEGAIFSESERRVHVAEDWAATPQTLPTTASYIALGHIHKPQKVAGALPAFYAGSPLQLDFGEVGQEKSFVVVNATAGRPAQVEHIAYDGGRPLQDVRASLIELETDVDKYNDDSWLRVTVPLTEKDPDINRKVRQILPKTLIVKVELPETNEASVARLPASASASEHYGAYHRKEHDRDPEPAVLETFQQLYDQGSGDA